MKPRPETTTLLARRLVIGALGIKADLSPEQRQAEREKLRLAKGRQICFFFQIKNKFLKKNQISERKQQVLKQMKDVWDGNGS